ncbi:MAG: hypothetical protein HeimC3_40000 [Candidatus Heimdallarchaeota archaeon LC_3]|nr:MAG: hypothetical protein HeimC3_40000 [Candidatus Heimdallarchaeota archaeon LC_3]
MSGAFVLINAETGKEREILRELKKIPFVIESNIVYGIYDLIIRLETENLDTLKAIITKNIRTIKFIDKTFTMIIEP